MASEANTSFDLARSRAICSDLFTPSAKIFWADLILSVAVTYAAAGVYLLSPLFTWYSIVCMIIAGFGLHRLTNFIHEISHLNSKRYLKPFRIGWNVIVGIPTLMPAFFFEKHMDHHNTHHFGTRDDCEYVPLARGPLRNIAFFMFQIFLQPVFTIFRFVIVTPISFLHPKLRQWTLENYSSFVFVLPCPRNIPKNAPRKFWAFMDIACCIRATLIFALVFVGANPWYRIPQLYFLAVFPLALHYTRSLTAHFYLSDGKKQSFENQLLDSIDITGNWLTELLYPIGLRYHALHHLFPSMPYHNLGKAHRRLMSQLPEDSPYRKLVYPSFFSVLRQLIRNARKSTRRPEMEPTPAA